MPPKKSVHGMLIQRDYYINETGQMVFTASYLRQRGYCCTKGCLHCPYPSKVRKRRTP
ncbi:MAG: DUF5522 domain-containing protein [Cytophagaceae bacterium]|nr:DUF5522 domain-containing protein [Cytophagaceae bacterium]